MEETRAYALNKTTASARDLSPYMIEAKELDEAQQRLSDILLELASRLRPVLIHGLDIMPENDTTPEVESSQYVNGLRAISARTRKATEIVQFILNNLEV